MDGWKKVLAFLEKNLKSAQPHERSPSMSTMIVHQAKIDSPGKGNQRLV